MRRQPGGPPLRVLNVITRMIVGGAQETPMLSCALSDPARCSGGILSGIETGAEGQLHDECRARGVSLWFEPAMVRRVSPWHDALALVRLVGFFRRGGWDVVHTHTSKAGLLGRIAARLAGVPVVVHTVHGWGVIPDQSWFVRAFYVWVERLCAPLCDVLVVVSDQNRVEGLSRRIGRAEQYVLIRSGIEVEEYSDVPVSREDARRALQIPSDSFVVACIGRLSVPKTPIELFEAFERVAARHPNAVLLFVGDGDHRPALEAAIARAGAGDRVRLLGLRRDVPRILRASDALVLASQQEGLPRVLPQAMAAGLPIVTTRVGGGPEAVADGQSGFVVEVNDVSAMADRLDRLASDPALARRMGACGQARVEEFSARRMTDQLQDLYERLAASRRRRT